VSEREREPHFAGVGKREEVVRAHARQAKKAGAMTVEHASVDPRAHFVLADSGEAPGRRDDVTRHTAALGVIELGN
jgi:hypothetical protein